MFKRFLLLTKIFCWFIYFQNITVGDQNLNLAPFIANQTSLRPGCLSKDHCYHGYCNNGGTCVDMWLSRHCQCPVGYIGDKCQNQNVAQFLPMSMLHFAGIEDIATLSLWVSSKSESGVIAYTVSYLYLLLACATGVCHNTYFKLFYTSE